MKQHIQLHTSQRLALTPQLQQSLRLLQLSTLDLNQELDVILLNNPLLERLDDPIDLALRVEPDGVLSSESGEHSDYDDGEITPTSNSDETDSLHSLAENDDGDYPDDPEESAIWATHSQLEDEDNPRQLTIAPETLREHLLSQATLNTHCQRDLALVSLLIETLDENGYLHESLEQILAELPTELGVELEDLHFALNFLQSLEPAGVGARSIDECLSLQINRLPEIPAAISQLALTIIKHYLSELAGRNFLKIKQATDCSEQELQQARVVIQRCQPNPGQFFYQERTDFITPDVVVIKSGQAWQAQLNQNVMPRLQINSLYANVLKQHKNLATLQSQLQEARWLIKNIHQRFETILRVSQEIVERQRGFFTHGSIAMRPLVLRQIADTLGLHESTISRVTARKYMLTPHGIFELKYFFDNHIGTEAGGRVSSIAIRTLIQQFIGAENHSTPLSDLKIANMLGQQGIVIARRTVAKYRETLRIPSANLRKNL